MVQLVSALAPFKFTPASIRDRAWWQDVEKDPRTRTMLQAFRAYVEKVPLFPEHPRASEFLAARRSNNRRILDNYWLQCRTRLSAAVVERCIDGRVDTGVDDNLLDVLWSFLTCPTWVVSAHLPEQDLPFSCAPQLDLAACEMAAIMAESLEMLQPWIEAQSNTLAQSIVYEIDRRVLGPFIDQPPWWCDPNRNWNNWAGVCAGSILAACEALANLGLPRPAARAKAINVLRDFIQRAFTPAGECDEGLGYWAYGMGFACLGWSRLEPEEFRQAVDMKRFRQVSDYPRRVHLFDDTFYSGNDASFQGDAPLHASAWLAAMTDSAWLERWSCEASPAHMHARRGNLCLLMRTLDALLRLPPPKLNHIATPGVRFLEDQQAILLQNNRLTVTFTGGHNDESHNHNDLGHFNVWVDRQLIVPDLSKPTYAADFFGPRRYEYLAASSRGHCCPLIHGSAQQAGEAAAAEVLKLDRDNHHLALDLTRAYPSEACLKRWTRSLTRSNGVYVFEDLFDTADAGSIEHVIWSTVRPNVEDDRLVLGPLTLHINPMGRVNITPVDPAAHQLVDFTHTLYRIAVEYDTAAGSPLRIETALST